jgi:hypothetical protein
MGISRHGVRQQKLDAIAKRLVAEAYVAQERGSVLAAQRQRFLNDLRRPRVIIRRHVLPMTIGD